MKSISEIFLILFSFLLFISSWALAQDDKHGKRHYTIEEIKQMCGVPGDKDEMKKVLALQDSMYKDYVSKKGLKKTNIIPDWKEYMSDVDYQGDCGNCWAHAATGMVEGQLQILHLGKIGANINLDEMDIVNNSEHTGGCDNGDFPSTALAYIQSTKAKAENGSFPNLQGVRWDINSFDVLGILGGIDGIKNALINGPVTACFYVYQSFHDFFDLDTNRNKVYRKTAINDPYIGGHAVVIVSYNDDEEYWLCKNSWGSWWADGGYFRIGYGQCGIESWQNCTTTVNQNCYAKLVPGLINSLNTAFSYGFVSGEWARLDNNNITLNSSLTLPYPGTLNLSGSNITVPAGAAFTVSDGAKVLLNGNSIVSSGGTINISSGAQSDGFKLLSTSNSIKGIYLPQTAVNNAATGEKVELFNSTYNSNISFSSKFNVDLSGNGISSSIFNGTISINNSQSVDINNLKAYKISVSGGYNNFTDNVILENPGTDVLLIYNCPSMTLQNTSLNNSYEIGAYINNSLGSFEYCNVEGHSDALYFYGNSNFNVDYSYLCGNNPHDIYAQSTAYVHAHNCTYSSSPQYSCYGSNVQWLGSVDICMAKSSASNFISEIDEQKSNKEFLAIDSVLTQLRGRVTEKIKTNKYDVNEFADEYQVVINDLKNLTKKYPADELVKTTVFRTAQCYQQLGRTNELKSYVEELLNDKNVETFYPHIERHLIPVYIEQKDYNNAIATAESVKKKSLDDEDLFCEMLYEEGLIYKYNLGNVDEANKKFNDIIANHPKNIMANFAGSELGIKVDSEKEEANPEKESNIVKSNNLEVTSYPNPFNPTTTISYTLPTDDIVTVKVFDMLGREVRTLVSDYKNAGSYNVIWDSKDSFGSEVASGIYFYNIKFRDNSITKKMVLVR